MEIREMTIDQLEERKQTIVSADMLVEGADLDALEAEMRSINTELEQRMAEAAAKEEQRKAIAEGAGEVITKIETEETEVREMITIESKEYRDAFYAMLKGDVTAEQRAVLATPISVDGDATNDGQAIAIPKTLDTKIWDNIHTAHPILADITTLNTGIALEVTKHTAITAGKTTKKKDGATNAAASVADEANTFVKVVLYGADYVKNVEITYAQAKMSQGALEDYLAEEISADLGEALAKDVFAQILSDAAANAQDKSSDALFTAVAKTLGKASHAVRPVIYCTAAKYYELFGATDSAGQPIFRNGVAIGADVKIDSAVPATVTVSSSSETLDYIVVDPSKFVLNQVQGVMVETAKDVKAHNIIISGYMRAEGCMRDNNAAAFLYE